VWRALAGVDSLAQAAGRCNRNGRLPHGDFVVFTPSREDAIPAPLADLRRRRSLAQQVLQRHNDNPLSAEAVVDFFARLFSLQAAQQDRDGCLAKLSPPGRMIERIPFRAVAADFRMIDDDAQSVIVPFNERAEKLIATLTAILANRGGVRRLPVQLLRDLQSYTVSVHRVDQLVKRGGARQLDPPEGRFHALFAGPIYDRATGMRPDQAGLSDASANLL
jgi:CRISPR-associated endonuclease/helicase Cas3